MVNCHNAYVRNRAALKKAISQAKKKPWDAVIEDLDLNVWGKDIKL